MYNDIKMLQLYINKVIISKYIIIANIIYISVIHLCKLNNELQFIAASENKCFQWVFTMNSSLLYQSQSPIPATL